MDVRFVADFAVLKGCLLELETALVDLYDTNWPLIRDTWRNNVKNAHNVKTVGTLMIELIDHIHTMVLGQTYYNDMRWRCRTTAADRIDELAPVLGILGRSAQWHYLDPRWRESERSYWLGKVNSLACGLQLGPYLVTFETGIQWSAVKDAWRSQRDPWTWQVMNESSIRGFVQHIMALVDVLVDEAWIEDVDRAPLRAKAANAWTEAEAADLMLTFKEHLATSRLSGYFNGYGQTSWTRGLERIRNTVPSLLTLAARNLARYTDTITPEQWELLPTELQDFCVHTGCVPSNVRIEPRKWRQAYFAPTELEAMSVLNSMLTCAEKATTEEERLIYQRRAHDLVRKRSQFLEGVSMFSLYGLGQG